MKKIVLILAIIAAVLGPNLMPQEETAVTETASTTKIWVFGDSIAAGTWLSDPTHQSWPAQLDAMMGGGHVTNFGMGGQAVAYGDATLPRMDDYVKSKFNSTPSSQWPDVVLFAGGINDMIRSADVSPTRWAVFDLTNWLAPKVDKVMVATLTPYASYAQWADTLNGRRITYNNWVRAQYGPTDQILEVGDLLTAGAYFDSRYNVDTLHPNAEGATIYAQGTFNTLKRKNLL